MWQIHHITSFQSLQRRRENCFGFPIQHLNIFVATLKYIINVPTVIINENFTITFNYRTAVESEKRESSHSSVSRQQHKTINVILQLGRDIYKDIRILFLLTVIVITSRNCLWWIKDVSSQTRLLRLSFSKSICTG